jgi:hypothetical protein
MADKDFVIYDANSSVVIGFIKKFKLTLPDNNGSSDNSSEISNPNKKSHITLKLESERFGIDCESILIDVYIFWIGYR